jgi:lysophospholipase L1-like esterase
MGPSIISNGTILTVRIKGLTASSPIDCEIVAIMTEVDVSAPSPFIPSDAASEGVATIPPLPQSTCTMIAWGDSLTAGSGGKWVDILAASLAGNSIVNKGVGGETSTQIATRMAAANYAELNRGIVIIWVGRNNFLSPATVLADLETMAALVPHGRFLVLGITNQTTEVVGGSNYNAIRALNAQIAMRFGRRYLDVRKLICQGSVGDSPRACWMSDATHMNQAGYGLIAAAIRDAIIANGFLDGQPIQKIAPEVTLPWQYQGAITTASTTVIKAATAEAWATVNGLQFINANGTATDISVQDTGGNILWVSKATANMPQPFGQKFDPPLMATQIGYGIQVVTSAAGDVRFNAQGDLQAGRI